MRIAFVCQSDAREVGNWSGIPFHMARALQRNGHEVEYVSPLRKAMPAWGLLRKAWRGCIRGQTYTLDYEPAVLEGYARQVAARLRSCDADVVLSPSSIPVSHLETDVPIVTWTDATLAGVVGFYEHFSRLSPDSLRAGQRAEQQTLDRCRLAVFASDWAARSAVEHYQAPAAKVRVAPFGANLDCSRTAQDIEALLQKRGREVCRLLFLGVDWKRKGGPLAVEVVRRLNAAGLRAELTVVGCDPGAEVRAAPGVRVVGFIRKQTPDGRERLEQLLAEAHFLLVPSEAECFGCVYPEANSFGVPALARAVGGVPTAIANGINGWACSPAAGAEEYSARIAALWETRERYEELARSSFAEYEKRLNWRSSAARVMEWA